MHLWSDRQAELRLQGGLVLCLASREVGNAVLMIDVLVRHRVPVCAVDPIQDP